MAQTPSPVSQAATPSGGGSQAPTLVLAPSDRQALFSWLLLHQEAPWAISRPFPPINCRLFRLPVLTLAIDLLRHAGAARHEACSPDRLTDPNAALRRALFAGFRVLREWGSEVSGISTFSNDRPRCLTPPPPLDSRSGRRVVACHLAAGRLQYGRTSDRLKGSTRLWGEALAAPAPVRTCARGEKRGGGFGR